jgi:hypothetical protein
MSAAKCADDVGQCREKQLRCQHKSFNLQVDNTYLREPCPQSMDYENDQKSFLNRRSGVRIPSGTPLHINDLDYYAAFWGGFFMLHIASDYH